MIKEDNSIKDYCLFTPERHIILKRVIFDSLANLKCIFSNEKELQNVVFDILSKKLKESSFDIEIKKEYRLSEKDIIDFMIGPYGVEVKIDTNSRALYSQLERYLKHSDLEEVFVFSTKTCYIPNLINGKPVRLICSRHISTGKINYENTQREPGKYGEINIVNEKIVIHSVPFVSGKLKRMFDFIKNSKTSPFLFNLNKERADDILWFIEKYPLTISDSDLKTLKKLSREYREGIKLRTDIMSGSTFLKSSGLKAPYVKKEFQLQFAELFRNTGRILNADSMGLGKTIEAILTFQQIKRTPIICVVQTQLPIQWKEDFLEKFTDYKVKILNKGQISHKDIEGFDIIITRYSLLSKHLDTLCSYLPELVVFDEIHELRNNGTDKYNSALTLSEISEKVIGMTGTPVYNYGSDIFNIMRIVNPEALGSEHDFKTEWVSHSMDKYDVVKDPAELRSYLIENHFMVARKREDVGIQLPPLNEVVYYIDYEKKVILKEKDKLIEMSKNILESGDSKQVFTLSGQLSSELRRVTGLAKAKYVADFAKGLLESGKKIIITGWHRDFWNIVEKELSDYKVLYITGSETPKVKNDNKNKFIKEDYQILFLSNRSGVGLDGFQKVCSTMINGELDYSPGALEQLKERVYRFGLNVPMDLFYLVADTGSDPLLVELLNLKRNQSIPFQGGKNSSDLNKGEFKDEDVAIVNKGKMLAEYVLKNKLE